MEPASAPRLEKVLVHVIHAFDVGLSVDLERAKQSITDLTELAEIKHKGHAPSYFQFDPKPLRVTQRSAGLACGSAKSSPEVDLVIYDFGGVSVLHELSFSGTLEELIALSCALAGSPTFREDARQRVAKLVAVIEPAVLRANIDSLSEDYLVFQTGALPGDLTAAGLAELAGPQVARLLRSEADALSGQEISDALGARVAFGEHDQAWIDWNAALLIDAEPGDVLAVLEFANLQLLELRFLDRRLDRALDQSYEAMNAERIWSRLRLPGSVRGELRRVAQLQVDAAILHERVNNALKLMGDQYLARVYRATSQRFRLMEWNSGILRKLEATESIYSKLHDQATQIRMEILEWIIILLIAFEIGWSILSSG
ncbi:MAG: hypothetical protein IPK67_14475 [Planctomycetes bacterium]|nr:hypothetical protein [Planctomycetota bacterium]